MSVKQFGEELRQRLHDQVTDKAELTRVIEQCLTAYRQMRDDPTDLDEFGMDPRVIDIIQPFLDFLYHRYWNVHVIGGNHIPNFGRALLVANHSGGLPYDGAMLGTAVRHSTANNRLARFLVEDFVYHFPYLGTLMYRMGGVRACPENAQRLLEHDHMVAVFPEGVKGLGKLYKDRYQLARFGRGGFVKLAIQTHSPIIPCGIVGAEEIHPILWKSSILAKSLGIPYLPFTPTFPVMGPLGLIPFPSQWVMVVGEPISPDSFPPDAIDDPLFIHRQTEQIREMIATLVKTGLKHRGEKVFR